jgi:outer membrane receptor protein involved in Fe transport
MYAFDPFAPRDDVREKLSDDQSTGTAKLIFFPTDSTMLYASFSTGFKAGGTNADRINQAFDQVFQAETSESIEFGLKGQYGRVQVVATVYQTDFEDFQANSFSGGGFNLQNAGDLTIEGVELEFLWRPTDTTQIQAWYAHNEGTFNSFEDGTAWDSWVKQIGVWEMPPEGDPGCADQPFDPTDLPDGCPRTGESLPYNPEDRGFIALTQDFNVGTSNTAFVRLEYSYSSKQTTDGDNDPLTVQDGYGIFNARIGLNFGNNNSSLTLWGRNITDERYHYGSFDIPVSEDKMMSYPGEPATYGITYRMNFD